MRTHKIYLQGLHRRERRIGSLRLFNKAHSGIVRNPFGEIMKACGIANFTVSIANFAQLVAKIGKGGLAVLRAKRQRQHVFNKRGAVKLTQIYHQTLVGIVFQGACHVRNAQELAGKKQHQVLLVLMAFAF